MPTTEVVFYAEGGYSPPLEWIAALSESLQDKSEAMIRMLEEFGHELRRPISDTLRDGILELRWNRQRVNYRFLYGYWGKNKAVILHGLSKEKVVKDKDIEIAIDRLNKFKRSPTDHTFSL